MKVLLENVDEICFTVSQSLKDYSAISFPLGACVAKPCFTLFFVPSPFLHVQISHVSPIIHPIPLEF